MVSQRFPEKTNYIPHAVPKELYYPLTEAECLATKRNLLGKAREDHFVVGYVSRNARRKMPSDIINSWKLFLDELEKKHGHRKATLLMHTDPKDPEGPNLLQVNETLGVEDSVFFFNKRVNFDEMRLLYNSFDTIVNRSCNEGFGLGTLEAMMCGKPIIALKTGGLTRQVEDHITGEQFGIGLDPEIKSLVGNQMVPYIYEDFVSHKTVADAFMKMYEMGPEGRRDLGRKAMEHAHKNYDIKNVVQAWDKSLEKTMTDWHSTKQLWTHEEM